MGQKQKPVRRLKHILFIADGMADYPCPELGGKTPLEAADAPNMRALARESVLGRVKVAGDSCDRVFSDTAFLSILGYGPDAYPGRGPLEALAAGVKFGERDVVARCNLVAIEDGRVAGYLNDLTEQETRDLLKSLDAVARRVGARFVRGSGYKHLIVIRNAGGARGARGGRGRGMAAVPRFSSPMPGESVEKAVVQCGKPSRAAAGLAAVFNEIQEESKKVFPAHPANAARERAGKKRVEMVWFWGAGRLEKRRDLAEKCGNTAVVSSVNVVNGIVKWLGGKAVEVPGATGYLDTDYEGKAEGVLRALEKSDFVIVHVQAPDEAGHEGDAAAKARAISDFDKRLLGRCLKALRKSGLIESCRIAVLPDHFTPVRLGRHAGDPVPFLLYRPGVMGEGAREYSEAGAKKGSLGVVDGKRFMQLFFGPAFEAKAVFFDLWSTLLHPSKRREYGEVKKILGLGMGYGQYVGMQEKYWFASPCMSEEKYLEIFCKKAGAAADEATVKRLARVWRKWRNRMRLFPEVRGVLEELGKKHRLAIVSNTEPATKEVEERHGLGKFFDATMYSCDAGVLKPDKRIFLEAARRLRVKPRECVMVGDNLRDDVAGAKKAGMKAVWVDRKGKGIASGARKRRRPGPDAVVGDLRELVDKKIL